MGTYRTIPVYVEAFQAGNSEAEAGVLAAWCGGIVRHHPDLDKWLVGVPTADGGLLFAWPGSWIIRDRLGQWFVYGDESFGKLYEEVTK